MVETHEYKGLWWLPSDDTEKLSGTLTVNKGDCALELIGHFGYELLSETGALEGSSVRGLPDRSAHRRRRVA